MRVLLLSPLYPPVLAEAEMQVRRAARVLDSRGGERYHPRSVGAGRGVAVNRQGHPDHLCSWRCSDGTGVGPFRT